MSKMEKLNQDIVNIKKNNDNKNLLKLGIYINGLKLNPVKQAN